MDQIFSNHYQSYFSFESFKEAFESKLYGKRSHKNKKTKLQTT